MSDPGSFWSARPALAHILTLARSRRVGPWAVLATLMFLHPAIERGGVKSPRVQRNLPLEPEATDLAIAVHREKLFTALTRGLEEVAAGLWSRLSAASDARSRRLARR